MKENAIDKLIFKLGKLDTCSIANAVDSLKVRLQNEGFSGPGVISRTPGLGPMVGRAVTLKVRSSEPPMKGGFYLDQPDWWERYEPSPVPRILVIEDMDERPGRGALVGPVHACILKAMGFVGVVTSGAIRGVTKFGDIGLHAFSANLSPAHSYCHVVEAGGRVTVADVAIAEGDIIHGDANGFVNVPMAIAEKVREVAAQFRGREQRICRYCTTEDFSPTLLRRVIGIDASRD
jgi:regulator of RNase E activity RraA